MNLRQQYARRLHILDVEPMVEGDVPYVERTFSLSYTTFVRDHLNPRCQRPIPVRNLRNLPFCHLPRVRIPISELNFIQV